jgi:class I fructose-bisphosphate aldolase
MSVSLSKISTNDKSLLLAYDQGLEHGPTDFDDRNIDPDFILEIAKKGNYSGVIFQKGIAEKYWDGKVPLVLKLNGKTNLVKGDPIAPQLCTVREAVSIGASAVGYTIYVGSIHEHEMFEEFERIQAQAHEHGLPVIAWMYPRGAAIRDELSRETLSYAARIGLELGADMIKMKYNGHVDDMKWVVKSAGRVKVLVAGGTKTGERAFLEEAFAVMNAGCSGMAVGRNVWQHREPVKMSAALRRIVLENGDVESALKQL